MDSVKLALVGVVMEGNGSVVAGLTIGRADHPPKGAARHECVEEVILPSASVWMIDLVISVEDAAV